MHVLDLFSGTGSVARVASRLGHEVTTLDINDKLHTPDIMCDILQWDYKIFPRHHFDVIWASPPCTEFSLMKALSCKAHGSIRNLPLADSLVKRTLEIIDYFQPMYYFIENPKSGLLKSREYMQGIPFYDVSYCQYGFDYRKHTRIWTNIDGFQPRVCDRSTCTKIVDKRHIAHVGYRKRGSRLVGNKQLTYRIPESLLESLFEGLVITRASRARNERDFA